MSDYHASKTPIEDHIRSVADDLRIPGVRLQIEGMDLCWSRIVGTPEVLHAIADRLSAPATTRPAPVTDARREDWQQTLSECRDFIADIKGGARFEGRAIGHASELIESADAILALLSGTGNGRDGL